MHYVNINRLTELPDLSGLAPFKCVLSVEAPVSAARQAEISAWLVAAGCRYAMIAGENCEAWCDSLRQANLAAFDLDTMHTSDFVMTTGHRHESLRAVFWYAKKVARHPDVEFGECVVVHIADGERSAEILAAFERA